MIEYNLWEKKKKKKHHERLYKNVITSFENKVKTEWYLIKYIPNSF